jgi:hypothetical protein
MGSSSERVPLLRRGNVAAARGMPPRDVSDDNVAPSPEEE